MVGRRSRKITYLLYVMLLMLFGRDFIRVSFPGPLSHPIIGIFELFQDFGSRKQSSLNLISIWHSMIWIIWKMRNKVIFCRVSLTMNHWISMITSLSWKKVQAHASGFTISLVDCELDPL